jgi:ribosomal protein L11 methyltransferase
MGHYEIKIKIPDESKEIVINLLNEIGCLGVTDIEGGLLAYFPDHHDIGELSGVISTFAQALKVADLPSSFAFMYTLLPDRDWNETWKKNIQPIDAGERLTIIPPWDKPQDGRINLIIDPGMAFGTGHHETTKTCLGLIEKLAGKVHKGRFLDVGTGTGILAVCAATLGFKEILAVDTDPLATEAAVSNSKLNNLKNIMVTQGDISSATGVYDMIAANLISETLIMIAPEIASRLNDGGTALLSGILVGQEDEVISAMTKEGLTLEEKIIDGERWVTLVFKH